MRKTLFTIFLLSLFVACKPQTIYVPVKETAIEYKDKWARDSIYLHDSVFVMIKGDTIFFEKYKTLYRDRLRLDSVYISDSIQVPYPVLEIKEVNKLRTWQIILMCLGGVLIGYLGFRLFRVFR